MANFQIVKKNNTIEDFLVRKFKRRLENALTNRYLSVDLTYVNQQVIEDKFYEITKSIEKLTSFELDDILIRICNSLNIIHQDYDKLSTYFYVTNFHRNTNENILELTKTANKHNIINKEYFKLLEENIDAIQKKLRFERDYMFSYHGFKSMEKSYLMRDENKILERPQHMFMRVALQVHKSNLNKVFESYEYMSKGFFTHATPTIINSGMFIDQLASCFLMSVGDSMEEIAKSWSDCALISKTGGGIGINLSDIRSKGSFIRKTAGKSEGIIKLMKVYNHVACYANQSGRRNGSFAIYLEPWHADVFEFLEIKTIGGLEENKCRDLFNALWVPDIFMKRVKDDGIWSLMCPDQCRDLTSSFGVEFELKYEEYERMGWFKKQVKARELWDKIIHSQVETGLPYMLSKDSINFKTNLNNAKQLIRCSNLCCEIVEYTDKEQIAVCNLASICVNKFIKSDKTYDYELLQEVVETVTENLNNVIDNMYYPVPENKKANNLFRPIGIGIQGLADLFAILEIPFESKEAKELNSKIFETIYYAALKKSCELSIIYGKYEMFNGSNFSNGILQFDLWKQHNKTEFKLTKNWDELKDKIKKYGTRNSLLLAPMPTVSTSQMFGNNDSFEPFYSNIYTRPSLSGDQVVINKHLLKKLSELNLWNDEIRHRIMDDNGSVQKINEIPEHIKNVFKTIFEIPQKVLIDMAVDRGIFIDQSQSMNLYLKNSEDISKALMYGWSKGLKTLSYYIRIKQDTTPIKFGVKKQKIEEKLFCKKEEGCIVCSS